MKSMCMMGSMVVERREDGELGLGLVYVGVDSRQYSMCTLCSQNSHVNPLKMGVT